MPLSEYLTVLGNPAMAEAAADHEPSTQGISMSKPKYQMAELVVTPHGNLSSIERCGYRREPGLDSRIEYHTIRVHGPTPGKMEGPWDEDELSPIIHEAGVKPKPEPELKPADPATVDLEIIIDKEAATNELRRLLKAATDQFKTEFKRFVTTKPLVRSNATAPATDRAPNGQSSTQADPGR